MVTIKPLKLKIDLKREKMKKRSCEIKTEKVLNFLTTGFSDLITIIGSIASWGVATAAGEEANAEAPGSVIIEDF
jgi:hypothetical protein